MKLYFFYSDTQSVLGHETRLLTAPIRRWQYSRRINPRRSLFLSRLLLRYCASAHLCPSLIPIRIVAVGNFVFHIPTFVMYLFFLAANSAIQVYCFIKCSQVFRLKKFPRVSYSDSRRSNSCALQSSPKKRTPFAHQFVHLYCSLAVVGWEAYAVKSYQQ
ncbi:hypothetical protein EV421DRAFT_1851231 [Armillaria borealis]|uniref:Uncharacterized protein n=1 Tax=Armillaria borealis TaxID=47425 RepID=A0AA39IX11_9AGAR|nr:hypothetical protein EV421DRAFT_1851231 [Armillaria borealis]